MSIETTQLNRRSFLKGLAVFAATPGVLSVKAFNGNDWQLEASVPASDIQDLGVIYDELGPITLIRLASSNGARNWIICASGKFKRIQIKASRSEINVADLTEGLAWECMKRTDEMLADYYYAKDPQNWREQYTKALYA